MRQYEELTGESADSVLLNNEAQLHFTKVNL